MGVHEPKYSSTLPSDEFATGAHLTSEIEDELGEALLPSSPRTGYLGYQMITAMEPLFYQYGVDLVLTGHEHNYERSYPVYLDKVSNLCLSAFLCLLRRFIFTLLHLACVATLMFSGSMHICLYSVGFRTHAVRSCLWAEQFWLLYAGAL